MELYNKKQYNRHTLKNWDTLNLFYMGRLIPKNTADGVTLPPADLLKNNSPSSAIPVILPSAACP